MTDPEILVAWFSQEDSHDPQCLERDDWYMCHHDLEALVKKALIMGWKEGHETGWHAGVGMIAPDQKCPYEDTK